MTNAQSLLCSGDNTAGILNRVVFDKAEAVVVCGTVTFKLLLPSST
jgi:hypothetical protein